MCCRALRRRLPTRSICLRYRVGRSGVAPALVPGGGKAPKAQSTTLPGATYSALSLGKGGIGFLADGFLSVLVHPSC